MKSDCDRRLLFPCWPKWDTSLLLNITEQMKKDIICFEYDRLNEQRFLAVVAKTGDLTGSAASKAGLMTVVNQIQQAFDNPYEDLYNMREVFINEVWVVTSGKIISGAQESVINSLRKSNLDKQLRIIGDDRLVQLIDKHFSTYWNSSSETKESVIIQRDRLLVFIESLLSANNVDKPTIEAVKSSILYSTFSPSIRKNIEGLYISYVSPYSVELAQMDSEFDDYIVSKTYGVTREIFQRAKKNLSYSFMDIEETLRHANKISKLTNPEEFAQESEKYLKDTHPFDSRYGAGSEFLEDLEYLQEGLTELKHFKRFLQAQGKLEWTKQLAKSISNLLPEIERLIQNNREDKIIIHFSIRKDQNIVAIEYDNKSSSIDFTIDFMATEKNGFNRNKDGTLKPVKVLESALFAFRRYVEGLLEYDEDKWVDEDE
jgi:hypothetical protein